MMDKGVFEILIAYLWQLPEVDRGCTCWCNSSWYQDMWTEQKQQVSTTHSHHYHFSQIDVSHVIIICLQTMLSLYFCQLFFCCHLLSRGESIALKFKSWKLWGWAITIKWWIKLLKLNTVCWGKIFRQAFSLKKHHRIPWNNKDLDTLLTHNTRQCLYFVIAKWLPLLNDQPVMGSMKPEEIYWCLGFCGGHWSYVTNVIKNKICFGHLSGKVMDVFLTDLFRQKSFPDVTVCLKGAPRVKPPPGTFILENTWISYGLLGTDHPQQNHGACRGRSDPRVGRGPNGKFAEPFPFADTCKESGIGVKLILFLLLQAISYFRSSLSRWKTGIAAGNECLRKYRNGEVRPFIWLQDCRNCLLSILIGGE